MRSLRQLTRILIESGVVNSKIDNLLENVVASSVGAPIVPFGGGALSIESSYAKPQILPDQKSHQDPGAEKRKKRRSPDGK